MHHVHQDDDQSVRKNEWLIQLAARGVRIFYSVFREAGHASPSPNTFDHMRADCTSRLSGYRACQLLREVRKVHPHLTIADTSFWLETIPGLVGVDTDLWPSDEGQRLEFCRRVAQEARRADAHLLFCDLGTGLATPRMSDGRGKSSEKHLYWDELRALFDQSSASVAIYQHFQRRPWANTIADYRKALESRQCDMLQLSSGRARIVLIVKPQHAQLIRNACHETADRHRELRVINDTRGCMPLTAA